MAGEELPRVEPTSRQHWRDWLAANHASAGSVWLVLPKKGSGLPGPSLAEAVDEALCFGWIDSLPRKLDDKRSLLLMSRRKPGSNWSAVNKAKIEALLAAGLIQPAGLAAIEAAKADGSWTALDAVEALEVPPDFAEALDAMPPTRRPLGPRRNRSPWPMTGCGSTSRRTGAGGGCRSRLRATQA